MKYEVVDKSPFYCTVLNRAFITGEIVEIENTDRADMLVSYGFLKPVVEKKKATRKKVNKDV
ncbi:Uncharacterised protein [uncultured Clostridium sp.]|nr:Uncharacterised protein [uncultured Clostridium sp.]